MLVFCVCTPTRAVCLSAALGIVIIHRNAITIVYLNSKLSKLNVPITEETAAVVIAGYDINIFKYIIDHRSFKHLPHCSEN